MLQTFYLTINDPENLTRLMRSALSRSELRAGTLWKPKNRMHLVSCIAYTGQPIPKDVCTKYHLWKTNHKVFREFYKGQSAKYEVHSLEEITNRSNPVKTLEGTIT